VGSDGSLLAAQEITDGQSSLFWMDASYEKRKLVALTAATSAGGHTSMVVVDFDAGEIVKRCPTGIGVENALADIPGKGLALVWLDRENTPQALLADPSLPCESSSETVPPTYIESIILNPPAREWNEMVAFGMDSNGQILKRWRPDGETVYLGYQIPEALNPGIEHPALNGIINNPNVLMAVPMGDGPDGTHRWVYLALRKTDGTWHRVPTRDGAGMFVRSLNHFLLLQAADGKWIGGHYTYSGGFDLYDLNNEKTFTMKQDDAEALLIEDGTLYYRVENRLYSAFLTDSGIGTPKLIAADEAIWNAHWAFIKH